MKKLFAAFSAILLISAPSAKSVPVNVLVDANTHSLSQDFNLGGGAGLATGVSLTSGQQFAISASPLDLWNIKPSTEPDFNANGITNLGLLSFGGLSAPFGVLAGRIGGGDFFSIGTSFSGVATATGELLLFAWDSNNSDNTGSITASIEVESVDNSTSVPLPSALPLFLAALALLGLVGKRRKVHWRPGSAFVS